MTLRNSILRLASCLVLLGAVATLTLAPTTEVHAQGKKDTRGKKAKGEPFKNVKSNRRYYRAVGIAESLRKDVAEKKAIQAAQAKIAGEIKVVVQQVNDDYVKETSTDAGDEFMNSFESLTRTVVYQSLYGCEQVDKAIFTRYKTKENKKAGKITYQIYVVMQMDRDKYLAALNAEMRKDQNKNLNYNKEKYEQIFDREMGNYGGEDTSDYTESGEGGEWDYTDEEPDSRKK
ncbi:MAG: hypothetical protein SFY70_03900 [Bacteroidia bacterium]|nr:hypothetical protein [Bacteroidia bacterium]